MPGTLGRSAGATDTGRRRRHNEDSYVVSPPVFAIADGMGGARAGEVASRLAAAVVDEGVGDERGEERVAELIREANRRVFQRSSEDEETSGMGTTMTVALVDGSQIAFGHVGDSRAYRVRGGEIEQLTDDHSLVGELVRSGRLSREEADVHPQRSVITRALGTEPDVDVDTFTVEAEPDDLYLLCSDGLTDMLSDREILELLEANDDLDLAARRLVEAANSNGGDDNITVVVFAMAAEGAAVEETVRMSPPPAAPAADDEDTLSGLDAVPVVDTAVVSTAEIERHLQREAAAAEAPASARREPRPEPRRALAPFLLLLVLVAALALLVVWGILR
ncbi:MAG TPA: Stp1/IreP family PP2C-type Ser/Thr phosphatase [Gaiellaceae bacterium]|nr:Stp1/IreP family PP2C-type Ser/Thr phosphatase [Gaiellaceae bacterium]